MKLLLALIFCSCIFQTCTTKKPVSTLFTPPGEWPIPDSTSRALKLQFEKGHVEHFTVNKSKFRFQKNSVSAGKYDLQVLQNGDWVTNLTLSIPEYTFFLSPDFDLDGFFDLSYTDHGNVEIYFFDNQKKQFTPKPLIFSSDRALLDSSKIIYGTNTQSSRTWNIDIFSIKNRNIYNLLKSKIFFEDNYKTGSSIVTYALVYKCKNGIPADTVLVDKININKQYADFGLNKFMKDLVHGKVYR